MGSVQRCKPAIRKDYGPRYTRWRFDLGTRLPSHVATGDVAGRDWLYQEKRQDRFLSSHAIPQQ